MAIDYGQMNKRFGDVKKRRDEEAALRSQQQQQNVDLAKSGGYRIDDDMLRRMYGANYGKDLAKDIFYTPEMEALKKRREDMAQGYSGEEMGALRETARGEMAGQRSNYLKQLQSKMARGGVGGARGAAMTGAADQQYAKQGAEAERKMLLDSAQMKRQGVGDLQDFIFRQKMGETGMMLGQQGLGAADYAAKMGRQSNSGGGGGICFITTAACGHFGFADDCDQLQTLRKFRDEVMLLTEGWKDDVKAYYELSKELGPKLDKIDDKNFWASVMERINNSVHLVKNGMNKEAYDSYKDLVEFVKGA